MGFLPWLTARLSCPLLPRLAWRGGCRLLALLGCLLSAASTARAHPLDEANLYHFFSCDLAADSLTVDYRLLVGGLAVFKLWDRMDTDRNKVLSEAEKTTFTAKM